MKHVRPFEVDDLAKAVDDYKAVKALHDNAERMATAKRKEMQSFEREAEKLKSEMERHANTVRKIAKEMP